MLDILKKVKPNRPIVGSIASKKVLTIIEGNLELRYLVKLFKINGYEKECYNLTEELLKVAWGIPISKEENIVNEKCNFQGGSRKDAKVPYPAIQAFELFARDLSIFDCIIVCFDGDKDINQEVEKYFEEKLSSLTMSKALVISQPCFESTLIDYCSCGDCRDMIDSIDEETYPCDKYKNNFSSLNCFEGTKHLIANLTVERLNQLKSKESSLNTVNTLIADFYETNQKSKVS